MQISLTDSYRSYLAIYTPGIVGVVIGAMMYKIPLIGRKLGMMISSALMAVSIFVLGTVNGQASNIGLSMMEYFFQSMFNAILYGWTPEVFPAPIRGTACGVASFWGRLFGIIAPLVAQSLIHVPRLDLPTAQKILYLAGGITLGCVLFTGLLPSKLIGRQSF